MKKMKKLLGTKRAFSPVIAALILMLLAVAAGVVVYSYTMGWIGGATTTTGGTQGRLQIDSIYGDDTTDTIKIYIRNSADKVVEFTQAYVNNMLGSLQGGKATIKPLSIGVATIRGSFAEGNTYTVKLSNIFNVAITFTVTA